MQSGQHKEYHDAANDMLRAWPQAALAIAYRGEALVRMEACGICNTCVSFKNNGSFNVFELDAASNNSVDDIRELTNQVRFAPQQGKYKVYIIDEEINR